MTLKGLFSFLIGGIFIALIISIYNNNVVNTTVLLQAGHEGRIKGNIGSINGNLKESTWNSFVTKEIEKELKRHKIDVTRVGADIPITNARVAIAIHFDGTKKPCSTGASIGYDSTHLNAKKLADKWREEYKEYFPFKWHPDNFTENLSNYYGFSRVHTEKGFLVLELGEITCDKQVEWLKPRLELISRKLADMIIEELD